MKDDHRRSPAAAMTPEEFDPVSWYTSQPSAVLSIHVPMSEMSWPKKQPKLRCRSAVKTRRQPGGGGSGESGEIEGGA